MKQTTNLKLNKPDYEDIADVAKLNENSDILDREVNDRLSTTNGGTVEKDLTIKGKLNANGETKVTGTMQTADIFVGGWNTDTRTPDDNNRSSLRVNGELETYGQINNHGNNASLGSLNVIGDAYLSGNTSVGGSFTAEGEIRLNNRTYVKGTLDMSNQSLKAGDGTFTGTLRADADFITHNVKPKETDIYTIGNSSKYYKKAYVNAITSKDGLTVDSDVTVNGALKASNLSADEALNNSSVNPVQNKVITAALSQKSDVGHKHKPQDIIFSVNANLKCVYTHTVHAEETAPDEGNHNVGWQVTNYNNFPVSTLNLAIEKLNSFKLGKKTYNTGPSMGMDQGVVVTEIKSLSVPDWSISPYNTLEFYTYGGYVRYIASGEYPEKDLIYGVYDEETFSLEFEANIGITAHTHSLEGTQITGTLPVSKGGTGGKTAAEARKNLGIGNVDNTSDMNKPVSNAVQAALSSYSQSLGSSINLLGEQVSDNTDNISANQKNIKNLTTNYNGLSEALSILRSDLTELQNSIKDKLPKGTTTYLFTPENVVSTAFSGGSKSYSQNVLSSPYYIELKSCRNRTVWVGLYDYDENFLEAQKCKLKLMSISEHQECPTIGLETKPTRDIRLAVIDLGVYENTENTEGYCTIVDGLAPLGLI